MESKDLVFSYHNVYEIILSLDFEMVDFQNSYLRTIKMAQWVKVFAAKPEDLSSIPGTYMIKGENLLPKVVL